MKKETKDKLDTAFEYCKEQDKSLYFTIEYLKDCANVSLDCVIKYLNRTIKIKHIKK